MKKISIFILAAIMLLCAQNAGAWSFKAETWEGCGGVFGTQTFYTDGYGTTQSLDVMIVTVDATQTFFNVYQDACNDLGAQNLYVSNTSINNGGVIRVTAFWSTAMENTYTVALPNGKVYVTPTGGDKVEMTKQTNAYIYTAIVPAAATVTVNGDDIAADINAYNGAINPPASLKLNVPNVPVSATANKIKVTYNLLTNQVSIEDFISEYCDWEYAPALGAANVPADAGITCNAMFTWETLANGNIEITINPYPGNNYALFRGANGFVTNGFKVNGDGNGNGVYFTKTLSADKTKVTLTPAQLIPEGSIISYSEMVEYKTTDNNPAGNGNDLYPQIQFPSYSYGTNCTGVYVQKLSTPTNISIDATNVLTFNEVANANTYIVIVKFGNAVIKTYNVAGSGEVLNFPFSGTMSVTVTASDNTATYANSDPSAPYTWIVTIPDGTAGNSIFCDYSTNPNDQLQPHFSIETAAANNGNIQAGDILITISGTGAAFRGLGVRLANFTVAGVAGATVLTKVSGDLDNPNVFRPIAGLSIPKGTLISYNGELEYSITGNGNGWGGRTFNNYVYGSTCEIPQLDPPANLVLGANNVLTFTPDANAASTTVYVMLGDQVLMTIPNFTSGSTVNFPLNGTFTIKGRSITADATIYMNSELSTGVQLVVNIADGTVGESEYCEWEFNPTGAGSAVAPDDPDADIAYLTWETIDNKIVVTISGTEEYAATTAFRADGLPIANLQVASIPALSWMTKTQTANKITFTPIAGITIPKGTPVTYNGMVLYRVIADAPNTELDNLWPTASFSYTYGASCALVLPEIDLSGGTTFVASDETEYGATVTIPVVAGTYPIAAIRFKIIEEEPQQPNTKAVGATFDMTKTADNVYVLNSLQSNTRYLLEIYAVDTQDNVSSSFGTLAFTTTTPTGLSKVENAVFSVYPSIVKDVLYLKTKYTGNIIIRDLSGRTVLSEKVKDKINVSSLNAGVYLVSLGNTTVKFVKE
ncbi:MAG: T9SS type A sorting domain-containing protein [Dysgonamonadaceae bacterium]|jgi:hypothetical protein|nr:T9SS type A sorting domain-containing protein [Dysgonamonadaceae bacterium]